MRVDVVERGTAVVETDGERVVAAFFPGGAEVDGYY